MIPFDFESNPFRSYPCVRETIRRRSSLLNGHEPPIDKDSLSSADCSDEREANDRRFESE